VKHDGTWVVFSPTDETPTLLGDFEKVCAHLRRVAREQPCTDDTHLSRQRHRAVNRAPGWSVILTQNEFRNFPIVHQASFAKLDAEGHPRPRASWSNAEADECRVLVVMLLAPYMGGHRKFERHDTESCAQFMVTW